MKNIIQFVISRGMDGYYVASAAGLPIVTQGKTLDELTKNIAEATGLYLEVVRGESLDEVAKYPSILMNYEVPLNQYA